ncbi:MAG: hypothetical protein Q9227_005890, partial [Pyrenula ochraceoflavens]
STFMTMELATPTELQSTLTATVTVTVTRSTALNNYGVSSFTTVVLPPSANIVPKSLPLTQTTASTTLPHTIMKTFLSSSTTSSAEIYLPIEASPIIKTDSCVTMTLTTSVAFTTATGESTTGVPYTLTSVSYLTASTTVTIDPPNRSSPTETGLESTIDLPYSTGDPIVQSSGSFSEETAASGTRSLSDSGITSTAMGFSNGGRPSPPQTSNGRHDSAPSGYGALPTLDQGHPSSPFSTSLAALVFSVGGSTYTANSASVFNIGGSALGPDWPAVTVSGTAYTLPSDGTLVLASSVGSNSATTINIVPPGATLPPVTLTNNLLPSTVSLVPGQSLVVGEKTLVPRVPVVIAGTTYSLAVGSSALAVGTSAIKLLGTQAYTTLTNSLLPSPIPLTPGAPIVIAGTTLVPGTVETISGTKYSLAPSSSVLVIGSNTISLLVESAYTTLSNAILPSPLSITAGTAIVIGGTALFPGAVETISGTKYSLAYGSTALVVGGSTISLSPTADGLGSYIMSGIGNSGYSSSTLSTTNASYTGPVYLGKGNSNLKMPWQASWGAFTAATLLGFVVG